uniref:Z-ring associated protein G n=1 Tax=Candidatus Kentrum sp. SD TaxID=2126332 RepID=A0A451BHM6_9GAMM|nr:MAG: Protein of unknown function (DUF1043) [Candidatus Kentron sp. SD]
MFGNALQAKNEKSMGSNMNLVFGIGIAMLAVGVGLGMLVAYFLFPGAKRVAESRKDLDRVTAEFAGYRERVEEHFSTTSDLFQGLTNQYRGLYDHLALGARDLCQEDSGTPQLDFVDVGLLADPKSRPDGAPSESDAQGEGKDSGKRSTDTEEKGQGGESSRT